VRVVEDTFGVRSSAASPQKVRKKFTKPLSAANHEEFTDHADSHGCTEIERSRTVDRLARHRQQHRILGGYTLGTHPSRKRPMSVNVV